MSVIGNILWFFLGGFVTSIMYFISGAVLCLTIIGIPFGVQLFKFGVFSLMPFGHEVTEKPEFSGCLSIGFNIIWIMFGWWEIAIVHSICGLIFCFTIIGIPFGIQHFKIALYSLIPFGRTIK